jgi:alpha-L-fucosidase
MRAWRSGGVDRPAGLSRSGGAWATEGPGSYTATWASVDQHPPAPQWLQDAKFGIYFHWGMFSVPAFGDEWYPRRMSIAGTTSTTCRRSPAPR